LEHVARPCCAL